MRHPFFGGIYAKKRYSGKLGFRRFYEPKKTYKDKNK